MKIRKVLFVTDASYPNLTMNGIVMKNIIDYLDKDNKVGIISLKQKYNDTPVYRNIKIKYVRPISYFIYLFREKRSKSKTKFMSGVYGLITLMVRIISISQRITSKIGLNNPLINDLKKAIDESLKAERYEYVVLIGRPFETFAAVVPLVNKYKKVRFIGYQVDNFVTDEDVNFPKFLIKRRNKERAKMLNACSNYFWRYFITKSVYSKEKLYLNRNAHIKIIGLPLILNQRISMQNSNNKNKTSRVNFVYAGSLLKGFRPPDDCLNILIQVAQIIDVRIDFYHRGNCDDILNEYSKKSNGVFINHGTVGSEKAYEAINSSDILIAISNFAGDQISGKTFDCISTGKPTIFFYYRDDDINIDFFNKYELGLCIRMSSQNIKSNVEIICKFIKENQNRIIDFNEVEKQFWKYTPEYIVDKLFKEYQ